MARPLAAIAALALAPVALGADAWAPQPGTRPAGARIAIVAYHDSRLFTLCPVFGKQVVRSEIWTDQMEAKVTVGRPRFDRQSIGIHLDDRQAMLLLPLPPSAPEGAELDRRARDVSVEQRLAAEFRALKKYSVVDSADAADLVLIAESQYFPVSFGTGEAGAVRPDPDPGRNSPGRIFSDSDSEWNRRTRDVPPPLRQPEPPHAGNPPVIRVVGGDRPLNWRHVIVAIAVPAALYREQGGNAAALVAANVWSGLEVEGWTPDRRTIAAASPELLARRFHKKGNGLPDYLPVCAARLTAIQATNASPEPAYADARPPAPATPRSSNVPRFSSNVTLVTVPVSVIGADGAAMNDLPPSAFHVFEDDVEQKVTRLDRGSVTADVAVLLDTSASMRATRDAIRASGARFAAALRSADRAMIVSIDSRIRVLSEFTSDAGALANALAQIAAGGGTRLYDGIALTALDALEPVDRRKAMIVVTDGVDTQSQLTNAEGALVAIESSNTPVYVVRYETDDAAKLIATGGFGVKRWLVPPEDAETLVRVRTEADRFLVRLASSTGGRLYVAQPDADLPGIIADIAGNLSRQTVLGYSPSNETPDGGYRRIRVTVDCEGCVVRARAGYRAGVAR